MYFLCYNDFIDSKGVCVDGGNSSSNTGEWAYITYDANNGHLLDEFGYEILESPNYACLINEAGTCTLDVKLTAESGDADNIFTGWGTSRSCTSGEKQQVTVSKDTTFYACWKQVSFNGSSSSGTGGSSSNNSSPGTGGSLNTNGSTDNDGNVTQNSKTGETAVMLVMLAGLVAIGYSVYYFREIKSR